MPSENIALIAGHLTRDPELKYLPKGTPVCSFGIGVNREYNKDGQKKSVATFIECKAWRRTAEFVAATFKKGDAIAITGEITTETWDDKATGQKRSKLFVTANSVAEFHEGEKNQSEHRAPASKVDQSNQIQDDEPPF